MKVPPGADGGLAGAEKPVPAAARRPNTNPTLSVIIPVHAGGDVFGLCLESLRALTTVPDEVIVVVDGADSLAARQAKEFGARVLWTTPAAGPAAARNLGARIAAGDILLFLDADVSVHPHTLATALRGFRDHPEAQAIIGSYDDEPAAPGFLAQYKNLLHHFVHQGAREDGSTFWGACGAIYRDVFLDVGGFDERYRRPSIEDIELGSRLKAAGHRIRVCKGLQVKHHKPWGALSLFWSDFRYRALPWSALILRTGRFENDLNINRSNRLKVGLAGGLLVALALSFWWPAALLPAAFLGILLLVLDLSLLRFFQKKRGPFFAARAALWHWFHYLYSGVAFSLALTAHGLGLLRGKPRQAAATGSQRLLAASDVETAF